MLIHYIKVAVRNIYRNKTYSLINILGLGVGMGVCLLIFQYVHFELSYDNFHPNAKNTYRITQSVINDREDLGSKIYTTYGLGPKSKEVVPEVNNFVRVNPQEEGLIVINTEENVRSQENHIWYVDSNFLQMFDFPLKYGNPESVLDDQVNVVITEEMSEKYFGDTNPVGKVLKISGGLLSGDFIVTGVLKELPINSHLHFDFLLPMNFLLENWRMYKEEDGWGWNNFVTYVTLDNSADLNNVSEKIEYIISTNSVEDISTEKAKVRLQLLTDIHLKSGFSADIGKNNGQIHNVRIFAIIAVFIILMAWVNYINLSTAQAIHRAKEVGVRKAIGADKKQLITQFLLESGMINLTAGILSIGVAWFSLPFLHQVLGKEFEFTFLHNPKFWISSLFLLICGTLLSGLYPAFVLSSYKPTTIFGPLKSSAVKGFSLRKSMIVFQFLISILLISGTFLVYQQVLFMKNKDLGMDIQQIVVINGPRVILETDRESLGSLYQTFKTVAANHHSISRASATSQVPGKGYVWTGDVLKLGESDKAKKQANVVFVDTDFFDTYDADFLAKRRFQDQIVPYNHTIINEKALEELGFASPENALKEKILFYNDTLSIVGVIKDIHWNSLQNDASPMLFLLDNQYGAFFSIQMNLENIQGTINHLESTYHASFPNDPFDYFFLEDDFNRQYQGDQQFGNLISAFSLLAIFIACLGLFGLVSFSASLRIKEIGIRKILGASIQNLMLLLSREYLVLLLISVSLSIPIIVFAAKSWLNNYAYKVDLGMSLILVPFCILLLISFLTVSYTTFSTARANPVKSLKSE